MRSLPSFDDFLLSVSEEETLGWTKNAQTLLGEMLPIYPPLDDISASNFATAIASYSFEMSKQLLCAYHAWLIRELEARSLHLL